MGGWMTEKPLQGEGRHRRPHLLLIKATSDELLQNVAAPAAKSNARNVENCRKAQPFTPPPPTPTATGCEWLGRLDPIPSAGGWTHSWPRGRGARRRLFNGLHFQRGRPVRNSFPRLLQTAPASPVLLRERAEAETTAGQNSSGL